MSEEVWSQAQRAKMWEKQHALMSRKHNMYKSGNTNEQKYKRTAWNPNANKIHWNNKTDEQARTKQKRAKQTIYNPILTTKLETGATN
jgi:hypothetical protein